MEVTLPKLRDYQVETVERLRQSLARQDGSPASILCSVTGGGKTVMAKYVMGRSLQRTPVMGKQTGNIRFAVNRRGLVHNSEIRINE